MSAYRDHHIIGKPMIVHRLVDTYTQNFNISTTSDTQRGSSEGSPGLTEKGTISTCTLMQNSRATVCETLRGVTELDVADYRKLTGIEHLNAHSLRHSFCHELISRKIPLDVVARLAGHVKNDGTPNIQQTLTYTQPGEDDLQRVVDEISWR